MKFFAEHPLIDLAENGKYRALSEAECRAMVAKLGAPALTAYVEERQRRLDRAAQDPLQHGFELPHWKMNREELQTADLLFNFGGNGSAKTTFDAKLVVEVLTGRLTWPAMRPRPFLVLCVAQDDTVSRVVQQRMIYEHLPPSIRRFNESSNKPRNISRKISYTKDGGFAGSSFTLPPHGDQCIFRNVSQYLRNDLSIEGMDMDLVIVDESCPLSMLEALLFRAGKRSGKIIYSFTAINGYDAVCRRALKGARVIKSLPMQWDWTVNGGAGGVNPALRFPELDPGAEYVRGCPKGHLPVVLQPLSPGWRVVFNWSHWNPFSPKSATYPNLPKIADNCVGRGFRVSLVRLFGYTEASADCMIPSFRADYWPKGNILRHGETLERLRAKPWTLYCADDPANARSHFLLWKAVFAPEFDERSLNLIIAESPTVAEGRWINTDGARGEGAELYKEVGVDWYKRYIRRREAGIIEEVKRLKAEGESEAGTSNIERRTPNFELPAESFRYIGDPYAFNNQAPTSDGTSKFMELFWRDDSGLDPLLAELEFSGAVIPRSEHMKQIEYGLEKLGDLFACDWHKEISAVNRPHLLIDETCENLIECIVSWDGDTKGPAKDPVDTLRYVCDNQSDYVDPRAPEVTGGGPWT